MEQRGRDSNRPGGDGCEDPAEETIGRTAIEAQEIQTPAGSGGARQEREGGRGQGGTQHLYRD